LGAALAFACFNQENLCNVKYEAASVKVTLSVSNKSLFLFSAGMLGDWRSEIYGL
jgi:hypothetical protein